MIHFGSPAGEKPPAPSRPRPIIHFGSPAQHTDHTNGRSER